MKVFCSASALAFATAANWCDTDAVFADMHDGDNKQVVIADDKMTIKPSGNDPDWTVNTVIDCKTGKASVDFDVPGKADHPPIPIQAEMQWHYSAASVKTVFEFTDPTGTLDSAGAPLNTWVQLQSKEGHGGDLCPDSFELVYSDMHDGDRKNVVVSGAAMTITPYNNYQEWTVNAVWDKVSCSAMVDFNVTGKADYPQVPLLATFWFAKTFVTFWNTTFAQTQKTNFEFTDPSGTLSSVDFPLNRWVESAEDAIVV